MLNIATPKRIMNAPTQLPPPSNWQDFQELCRVLWKHVWSLSDEDIIPHGDNGDKQDGVDICAVVGNNNYFGIQCKSKDQLKGKQITKAEIQAEIEKAKSFSPKLSKFLIVTSAPKNARIDNYALQQDAELHKQGYFSFRLLSWNDVCKLLMEHKPALDFYQNKEIANYKIDVSMNGSDSYTIHPVFLRKHIHYKLKNNTPLITPTNHLYDFLRNNIDFQEIARIADQVTGYYEHYHTIPIYITNVGDSVLRNIKFELVVEYKKIKHIDHDDNCYSLGNYKGFGYKPIIYRDLVQNDSIILKLHIIPKDDTIEIKAHWAFWAEDFSTQGNLTIHVEPQYKDTEEVKEVEREDLLKEDEIIIEPIKEKCYNL